MPSDGALPLFKIIVKEREGRRAYCIGAWNLWGELGVSG